MGAKSRITLPNPIPEFKSRPRPENKDDISEKDKYEIEIRKNGVPVAILSPESVKAFSENQFVSAPSEDFPYIIENLPIGKNRGFLIWDAASFRWKLPEIVRELQNHIGEKCGIKFT